MPPPLPIKRSPSGARAVEKTEVALVVGDVPTIDVKEVTATIAGLRTTDNVAVNTQAALAAGAGVCGARVSAADTIAVEFVNPTAAGVTVGTITVDVLIFRFTA